MSLLQPAYRTRDERAETTSTPPASGMRAITLPPPSARAPAVRTTVASAIVDCLEDEGVRHLFGVPGAALTPLYEALSPARMTRHVLAKHEEGAAFMAAAYARVRGGLAACCATTGPGATNAVTGVASAYADSLPVLLLTGQTSTRQIGKGAFQESSAFGIDVVQILRPITKLSVMVPSADRAVEIVQHAIRLALSGRPGPVHVSLPADLLAATVEVSRRPPAQYRASAAPLDRHALSTAARVLVDAERPVILAGHGVSLADAAPELLRLAERLSIPVATSPKAKGVFPENHPLSLGVFGFAGHPRADAYLQHGGVDALLVVGSSLGEWTTNAFCPALQPSGAFMQIDIDATAIGRNYDIDVGVVGDARVALDELDAFADMLLEEGFGLLRDTDPLERMRARIPSHFDEPPATDEGGLDPRAVVRELRAALPDDGLLFVDIGNAMSFAGHHFEARAANTYLVSMGLASMGSAVAGAVGGKLAAPDKKVVALVGDGAFAMHGMEVHTAVELDLPVVWVVLNDSGYGMIKHGERLLLGADLGACQFRSPLDVAGLAEAMGARGRRVSEPAELRAALREALDGRGPCVIDAAVDASVAPGALVARARNVRSALRGKGP